MPASAVPVKISASFRLQAIRAILAIIAFILVYIILFLAAIALALACMYGGFTLITVYLHWISLLFGLGLIGLGLLVFFFLIKFLFESNKEDMSDAVEITAAEQPRLVAFIYDVAARAGAAKPKKIFISNEVNASVFYNAGGFWRMFVPVKKNLKIGLGLINALNIGEFEAVLAHEFGHFSQRSMKLGSFVYNVNRIIFNMLFKNSGYSGTLQGFANIHGVFFVFAQITAGIVTGIQWILRQMYKLVNLCYLGLSRQMEFHADLVAARVSGSNNIISSLLRVDAAQACYTITLHEYDRLWKDDKRATDIYADHRTVLQVFARQNKYETENGLPLVPVNMLTSSLPRININNQWASHPTTAERHLFLEPYSLTGSRNTSDATDLLEDEAALKDRLTRHIYRDLDPQNTRKFMSPQWFEDHYLQQEYQRILPPVYADYFANHFIDTKITDDKLPMPFTSFSAFFNTDLQQLPKNIDGLREDIAVLTGIEQKQIIVRSFDLNGVKYPRKAAAGLRAQMEAELEQKTGELKKADHALLAFSRAKAAAVSAEARERLENLVNQYDEAAKQSEAFEASLQGITDQLAPMLNGQPHSVDYIKSIIQIFKSQRERDLKKDLQQWIDRGAFEHKPALRMRVKSFIANDYAYFSVRHFKDQELEHLHTTMREATVAAADFVFEKQKLLLAEMAEYFR